MKDNSTVNILIVEDEILLAYTMKEMLAEMNYNKVVIQNTFDSAKNHIENNLLDLVILDINLENGNEGLELARTCFLKDVPFFYVTSYTDKKTLDLALETSPGAYVIKPVIAANLYSALNLSLNQNKKDEIKYFTFKDGIRHIKLDERDISYFKADGIYVEIHSEGKKYLNRCTLANLLDQLPKDTFIQTHRSFVVNKYFIDHIESNRLLIGKVEIPISRTFKEKIKQVLLVS